MYKIIIPQSNPNDEYVFIIEWKFNDNDFIKKGDHILSVETSKVIEEIFSENDGYLEKLFDLNDKVKVGNVVGILNKNKTYKTKEIPKIEKLVITKKAQILLEKNMIDPKVFSSKKIIKEIDVLNYTKKINLTLDNNYYPDQLIILKKQEEPYHAALYLSDHGIIDLSLLGSKITKNIEEYNFLNCKCEFFLLDFTNRDKLIEFYNKPALLTEKILKKEKSSKGWSTTVESADYILKFRKKRSIDINDMNCIEWLVYGFEKGSIKVSDSVLTASKLKKWAENNLKRLSKNKNLEFFQKLY